VYCIFRQVSHRVARGIADAQYRAARVQPKAALAEHLDEFEELWNWMTGQWQAELSAAERKAFALLGTEIECDLFRILMNFAHYARSQERKDFPFPLQHVADRLGVSFQYVSKLRRRLIDGSIIVQTEPAITNRCAARVRWCLAAS
jgi:CRP-like cAMP-binding protein